MIDETIEQALINYIKELENTEIDDEFILNEIELYNRLYEENLVIQETERFDFSNLYFIYS